uniref:Lectin n=1 Tax=Apios americana TaxID=185702 RepID=C8KIS6_9FABA|nr:lectin [Apios americana]
MAKPQHMSSILVIVVTFLFLLEANAAAKLPFFSFNLDRFFPNEPNLIFQGDAKASSTGVLEVTKTVNGVPVMGSIGRVLYSSPFHVWDSQTKTTASFVAHLTFVIASPPNVSPADGLAFFITPPNSPLPKDSGGGFLGLFGEGKVNDTSHQTVAVEFDTCYNMNWDPSGSRYHIGIDVNSIKSVATVPWVFRNGEVADAVITYFGDTNYLSVTLIYGESQEAYELGHFVDLKNAVPEWVSVGISATVGTSTPHNNIESNNVLSWSFHAFQHSDTENGMSARHAMLDFLHQHHPTAFPKQSSF